MLCGGVARPLGNTVETSVSTKRAGEKTSSNSALAKTRFASFARRSSCSDVWERCRLWNKRKERAWAWAAGESVLLFRDPTLLLALRFVTRTRLCKQSAVLFQPTLSAGTSADWP